MGLGWEGPSEGGTGGTGILAGNSCISAGLAQKGSQANLGLLAAVTTFQELQELDVST